MKLNFISVLAGSAAVALFSGVATTAAQAQTTTIPVQYPFAVKLGVAFPTNKNFSDTAFNAGLSYDLSKTTADKPVVYQVYGDYYGQSSSSLIGIGLSAQFALANATSPTRPYVGVGVGDYIAHASGSSTKSNFGGKVFAGYNFTQNVFGEVDYQITQKINGTSPDAIGLRAGYRF